MMLRILSLLLLVNYYFIIPQDKTDLVFVDESGKLKWTSNNEDAYFFGVNYSVPFAFSYRALKNKNISHKEVIDLDVKQFKRLGMNAYRIHVWDREIADKEGNILNKEHLELLDYLISKLIENDIYVILTPIAWWGTGWPEPDIETPGFSSFYSKIESTTKPEVLKAHLNYLKQFLNHKNSFTGKTYSTEEKIIAYEVFNEPNLPKDVEAIKFYVNSTVKVFRDEGITKPVFFNISENPDSVCWEGVASSNIDGVSFQWYPTGLVKLSELKGNFLPNVFSYKIPNYTNKLNDKAKIVYEFDAADIGNSTMYPLMAQSFREAGMQWATMFCYDPTPLAQYNSEYSTHYLNLLYTPQKALSFLIASKIFTQEKITEKKTVGSSITFNNYFVDYEKDLSVLNNGGSFIYTNSNDIQPIDKKNLLHIAGFGNSNLIKYEGRGCYFIDRIEDDLWQLEIYPDAVWLKDPFGKNGLENEVAKLIWKDHSLKLNLDNLNQNYYLFDEDGKMTMQADSYTVAIQPGRYFISNNSKFKSTNNFISKIDFTHLRKYGSFISDFKSTVIKNLTPESFEENQTSEIHAEIYSSDNDINAYIYFKKSSWRDYQKEKMISVDKFVYEFVLPENLRKNGFIDYFIAVEKNNNIITFPGNINSSPNNWDFNSQNCHQLKILPSSNETVIYDPINDKDNLIFANVWRFIDYNLDYTFDENFNSELSLYINKIKESFPELAFQVYVGEQLNERDFYNKANLQIEAKNINEKIKTLKLRFLFSDGSASQKEINLSNHFEKIKIDIPAPDITKFALLPRPYPTFLPYWYTTTQHGNTNEKVRLESIQIAIPLNGSDMNFNDGIKIKKIKVVGSNE